jgi:hypothetical protein
MPTLQGEIQEATPLRLVIGFTGSEFYQVILDQDSAPLPPPGVLAPPATLNFTHEAELLGRKPFVLTSNDNDRSVTVQFPRSPNLSISLTRTGPFPPGPHYGTALFRYVHDTLIFQRILFTFMKQLLISECRTSKKISTFPWLVEICFTCMCIIFLTTQPY